MNDNNQFTIYDNSKNMPEFKIIYKNNCYICNIEANKLCSFCKKNICDQHYKAITFSGWGELKSCIKCYEKNQYKY